ncbi:ATP-utilizing chromatin assembly and remodelling N-terminal-domain-containing protein [Dipodascopsis uninucleata]
MVLFKRKIVTVPAPPVVKDGNPEVWYIKQTGEYFMDYDNYVKRMDFYNQRRFICELTGHSNLSFFEALESETSESKEVDETFPEALKEPVLRRVQFSTVSRLDHLVDEIYNLFRNDFFPGEFVYASTTSSSEKLQVVIREKAQFNAIKLSSGETRPAYSKYRLEIVNGDREGQEEFVDESQISRDRRFFSKSMLRIFLKNTLSREAWNGAPWLVKANYAAKYRIDTEVPLHLQRHQRMSASELAAEQAKKEREKKRALLAVERERIAKEKEENRERLKREREKQRERDRKEKLAARRPASTEDLDCIPLTEPPSKKPRLLFEKSFNQKHIGMLLETWSFLNMFHQTLVLDTFTLDEFIGALQYNNSDYPCELFVEVHCSLLKLLIDRDSQDGELNIELPEKDEGLESEADENEDATQPSGEQELQNESRVKEMQRWRDGGWKERLQRRLFTNGGMEVIILGLLDDISYIPDYRELCIEVIEYAAPEDMPATMETAKIRYAKMDKVLKLSVLNLICQLINDSSVIRDRIEYCMEESTRIRRERLETHKEHKALLEAIKNLEEQRESHLPPDENPDPEADESKKKLRSAANVHKDAEINLLKTNSDYRKIVEDIEKAHKSIANCIESLKRAEVELRVLDCQRARSLGRDRFYNRYWWFEGNGLPTALGKQGFLMGRLWVQGPSAEDLEVFIKEGKVLYGEMSFQERQELEEPSASHLADETCWGYYDDPAQISELMSWLALKGARESRLRKELDVRRDRILNPIMARRRYLGLRTSSIQNGANGLRHGSVKSENGNDSDSVSYSHLDFDDDDDDDLEDGDDEPRRSSRQRAQVRSKQDARSIARDLRFLNWHNTAAANQFGRTHFEYGFKKKTPDVIYSNVTFGTPLQVAKEMAKESVSNTTPVASAKQSPVPTGGISEAAVAVVPSKRKTTSYNAPNETQTSKRQTTRFSNNDARFNEPQLGRRSSRRATAAATNSFKSLEQSETLRRSGRHTRSSARFD